MTKTQELEQALTEEKKRHNATKKTLRTVRENFDRYQGYMEQKVADMTQEIMYLEVQLEDEGQ